MAVTLKLVRLDDFIADIDSVDLLSGGYSLAADGYAQVVAPIGAKSVHETITLNIHGTSTDNLATLVQEIDEKIRQVQWWIEDPGIEMYQVWLRVQMDEESYTRQAQILNILPPDSVNIFTKYETDDHYITEYTFGIERTPFWERPYPYPSTTTVTGLSSAGGMGQLAETINGDVPARLAILDPMPNGSDSLCEFWVGWKSNRFGNPANFVPVCSLDGSIYLDTDTTATADATAVNGNKVRCTFGTDATLIQRTITQVNDVVADSAKHTDQRGTYLVLLRAKLTDTSSITRIRIAYSFSDNLYMFNPVYRARQIVKGSQWQLYPMGIVAIPPLRITPGLLISNAAISIQAERISGSGSLDMDCLTLIPVDDGAIHVDIGADNTLNLYPARVSQNADGTLRAFKTSPTYVEGAATFDPINYTGLIANNSQPYVVAAGQKYAVFTGGQDKINTFTEKVDVAYNYIPRWRTLRGSGTGSLT
jgi:hypothetical protein